MQHLLVHPPELDMNACAFITLLPPPFAMAPLRTPGVEPFSRAMRSSLLLWAACTGRASATWVCGGDVEITKSWDNKDIDGHCSGDSRPIIRTRHLAPPCSLPPSRRAPVVAHPTMNHLQETTRATSSCRVTGCPLEVGPSSAARCRQPSRATSTSRLSG